MTSPSVIQTRMVRWRPTWRLVPSRFPPDGLFDRVATPADLEAVFAVESLTNDRLREEVGDLGLVEPSERVSGPGTTPIMAAFTHLSPAGSRFSDGTFGVYYAARRIETAVAETVYHRARFLRATEQPPIEIDMRSYAADLNALLEDLRGCVDVFPDLYRTDPSEYAPSQTYGRRTQKAGANGIVYDSVRHSGGECVAIFKPRVLSPVRQGPHYCYHWDGVKIDRVLQKSEVLLAELGTGNPPSASIGGTTD